MVFRTILLLRVVLQLVEATKCSKEKLLEKWNTKIVNLKISEKCLFLKLLLLNSIFLPIHPFEKWFAHNCAAVKVLFFYESHCSSLCTKLLITCCFFSKVSKSLYLEQKFRMTRYEMLHFNLTLSEKMFQNRKRFRDVQYHQVLKNSSEYCVTSYKHACLPSPLNSFDQRPFFNSKNWAKRQLKFLVTLKCHMYIPSKSGDYVMVLSRRG